MQSIDITDAHDPQRRRAWALLSRVAVTWPAMVAELVHAHGPLAAAERIVSGVIDARYGPREWERAEDDLVRTAQAGGRLLTRDDPQWPARLADLDRLGADVHAPIALWVRGTAGPDLLASATIAVVGARTASVYGVQVTQNFAGSLAHDGWTILSGVGCGVDVAAHYAAMSSDAAAVAVLPCGLGRPHPAGDESLLDRIARTGLVISEYPPGTEPAKSHFLHRNRIVAALSRGLLVCEAGLRGGTSDTVNWAARLGRPVTAVPGPITSAASAGVHHMIRTGQARLVTTIEEILEVIPAETTTRHPLL